MIFTRRTEYYVYIISNGGYEKGWWRISLPIHPKFRYTAVDSNQTVSLYNLPRFIATG